MAISTSEREILHQAASIILRETDAGERVILRDFGSYIRKDRKARTARNPKTGEAVQVAASSVLTFKASKATKAAE